MQQQPYDRPPRPDRHPARPATVYPRPPIPETLFREAEYPDGLPYRHDDDLEDDAA